MTTKNLSPSETVLLKVMNFRADSTVVATGIVEVQAAQSLIEAGIAEPVIEYNNNVDKWGAGSMKLRLKT